MGSGTWTTSSYKAYSTTMGRVVNCSGNLSDTYSHQDIFTAHTLDKALDPKNIVRECCDSDEHPNTKPVILALDVTGSMGDAATEVAKKLNAIMTDLYDRVTDVEFLIMGIGDLSCDIYPIQASQFESDIRIAEQLDKLYFEFGGGGNSFESYTAAWYFGSRHTKLDCWKRGQRGTIITIGDERLNPYLPKEGRHSGLTKTMGDQLQSDIETSDLYKEVLEKFDVYHLDVKHGMHWDSDGIIQSWTQYLDNKHFRQVTLDSITDEIVDIIINATSNPKDNIETENIPASNQLNENGEITW